MASVCDAVDLPPGFRFHPTDEEIITHYLSPKVVNPTFSATAVGEADLNKCEPWDLPSKAKMGEKDWYFFCQRDRKYPTGTKMNRATESGYWKATGKDKQIFQANRVLVGMKKTLVFYLGRAPKGEKTNWVMHEFRLEGKKQPLIRSAKHEWVVSKVFYKSMGATTKKSPTASMNFSGEELPPLKDPALESSAAAIRAHCKAEQFPSHSIVSHDTGLSTDGITEISSVASRNNVSSSGAYDNLDDQDDPVLDFDNIWEYLS